MLNIKSSLRWLILCIYLSQAASQSLEPFARKVGSAFCMFLAYKSVLPRKYFNLCGPPSCGWDDWKDALVNSTSALGSTPYQRIVVSYSHNGFGNQLWEHSVAFMVAESLKARLLIAMIPDSLSPGGFAPPNSWSGMSAMERLLPSEFLYESLPATSPIRYLCDNESFVASDRPYDWRGRNYSEGFRPQLHSILSDPKPRCLKMLGYFQNLPLCQDDARQLWMSRLISNFTMRPGENDVSIYLRCIPRHYHFNDAQYYDSILNNTKFDRIWLFQAPECPTRLSNDPSRDGLVTSVMRLLVEKYNATRWPAYEGPDDTTALLHDLAGLAMSRKLILPLSSWAFWAGMLSNATEIHVNAPPFHPLMPHNPQYIYHDERNRMYFGRYNATENDIEYLIKPVIVPTSPPVALPVITSTSDGHRSHHRTSGFGPSRYGHSKYSRYGHGKTSSAATSTSSKTSSAAVISNATTVSTGGTDAYLLGPSYAMTWPVDASNHTTNITLTISVVQGTSVLESFTHLSSSTSASDSIVTLDGAINREFIAGMAVHMAGTVTRPPHTTAANFDVKIMVIAAIYKQSSMVESFTYSYSTVDSRPQNATMTSSLRAEATIDNEAVIDGVKTILSTKDIPII